MIIKDDWQVVKFAELPKTISNVSKSLTQHEKKIITKIAWKYEQLRSQDPVYTKIREKHSLFYIPYWQNKEAVLRQHRYLSAEPPYTVMGSTTSD